jgi:hypothetical protein
MVGKTIRAIIAYALKARQQRDYGKYAFINNYKLKTLHKPITITQTCCNNTQSPHNIKHLTSDPIVARIHGELSSLHRYLPHEDIPTR